MKAIFAALVILFFLPLATFAQQSPNPPALKSMIETELYVPNALPYIGRDASVQALTPLRVNIVWQPIAGEVSLSGDLGYTHGTYEKSEKSSSDDPKKIVERGSYVRIWQKHDEQWQIVLDVTNAHPK